MADEQLRGGFVWHELLTTDTNAAESFYQRVVGWSTKAWSNDDSYTLFMAGDNLKLGSTNLDAEQHFFCLHRRPPTRARSVLGY